MASLKRNFSKEGTYHIYNRGNHRERIFHHPEDYLQFLVKLKTYARREDVEILCFCLMANHYHLLMRPSNNEGLSRLMRSLGSAYAQYHNRQYGQVGHLWQGRFGARAILDAADLINVSTYIHRNPARYTDFMTYRWSDVRRHTAGAETALLRITGLEAAQYERYISLDDKSLFTQPPSGGKVAAVTALR